MKTPEGLSYDSTSNETACEAPIIHKGSWHMKEDNLLRKLVSIHGTKRWTIIAKHMTNRKGKQCRER